MKRHRWILGVVVLLPLAFYLAHRVNWQRAAMTLAGAAIAPLLAATLINLVSLVLHGTRWWLFLRRVGAPSLPLAVRATVIGAGLNNLLVASGGDIARVLLVARASGVSRNAVLATVALDRLFDPICFVLLLLVGTFALPLPRALADARPIAAGALLVLAIVLIALVRAPALGGLAEVRGWRANIVAFRDRVAGLSTAGRFAGALALSIAIWSLQVATFVLSARAVHLALPLAGALGALLLTNAGLVLRATPGNIGYFQFAYAVAVAPFGIGTDAAIAASLLLQLVQMVPVTLWALALAPHLLREADPDRPRAA